MAQTTRRTSSALLGNVTIQGQCAWLLPPRGDAGQPEREPYCCTCPWGPSSTGPSSILYSHRETTTSGCSIWGASEIEGCTHDLIVEQTHHPTEAHACHAQHDPFIRRSRNPFVSRTSSAKAEASQGDATCAHCMAYRSCRATASIGRSATKVVPTESQIS